jgi:hypothetical protein
MTGRLRSTALTLCAVALATALLGSARSAYAADPPTVPEPVISGLSLTASKIHAVGVKGTGLPKRTQLELTLNVDSLVRIRVKAVDPYGLRRAFNVALPTGQSSVPISARVDGTKMPPGAYKVVIKAHNSVGSSDRKYLRLKIVGR